MMLVLQIAAGIVLALVFIVVAPVLFSAILQVFADDRRRVEKRREKKREEKEQRKSAEKQDPSLRWKRRWKTLKTYMTALAAYLLVVFLVIGYIVLAAESLLPSFLQRLWDG